MTVVPLVFAALVIGVYELGREHGLGGVAARTLVFTLLLSAMSVGIGVILVNVLYGLAPACRRAARPSPRAGSSSWKPTPPRHSRSATCSSS